MTVTGDRLNRLRKSLNLSMDQLGKAIGYTKQYISAVESGKQQPGRKFIVSASGYFNVTPNYLMGIEDIENGIPLDRIYWEGYAAAQKKIFTVSKHEQSIIEKYRELAKWQRDTIDYLIDVYIDNQEDIPKPVRQFPIYSIGASAGLGSYLNSDDFESISVPDDTAGDFGIKIVGDSMLPRFSDGDIVTVKKQDSLDYGDIGIFSVNGESYIKQYTENGLHSLNPSYQDIQINEYDEFKVFGKVIGKLNP